MLRFFKLTGGDGGDAAKNAARRKVMSEWLVWKLGQCFYLLFFALFFLFFLFISS